MAAQDVADLVPRVRRALEGAGSVNPSGLSDLDLEAAAADAIGDLILATGGAWKHTLEGANGPPATHWQVDPGLTEPEASMVAIQAALTFFIHALRTQKVAESMQTESRQWSWELSASTLRDVLKALKDQRDLALAGLEEEVPVFARVHSFIQAHDSLTSALVEPWVDGGNGGGGIVLWGEGTIR
jgi:hypothetical protein